MTTTSSTPTPQKESTTIMSETAVPMFGQAADDYVPAPFDPDDVWILNFKEGSTQIRICPATRVNEEGITVHGTRAWITERLHYDEALKLSFPCSERFGLPCPGCLSTSGKTRERTRAWMFNALDKDGNLRIFKMGKKLFDIFQAREQRALARDPQNLQPLSDRDYHINRSGKGRDDTIYDPESGDAYPVEWPEELHDIPVILTTRYKSAVEQLAAGGVGGPIKEPEVAEPTQRSGRIPSAKAAAAPAATQQAPAKEPNEGVAINDMLPDLPTVEDLEDATTPALKDWLDRKEVDYPSRSPRARLLELAKKELEPPF